MVRRDIDVSADGADDDNYEVDDNDDNDDDDDAGQTNSKDSERKRRRGRNTNHNRRLGWQALILNANGVQSNDTKAMSLVVLFQNQEIQSARKHAKKLTKNHIIAADMHYEVFINISEEYLTCHPSSII
uniref:Uncharacterized protein n=1 Tax=Glossina pallidipes TaxID=7398 RepID=A0A1B0A6N2_GLOPL